MNTRLIVCGVIAAAGLPCTVVGQPRRPTVPRESDSVAARMAQLDSLMSPTGLCALARLFAASDSMARLLPRMRTLVPDATPERMPTIVPDLGAYRMPGGTPRPSPMRTDSIRMIRPGAADTIVACPTRP